MRETPLNSIAVMAGKFYAKAKTNIILIWKNSAKEMPLKRIVEKTGELYTKNKNKVVAVWTSGIKWKLILCAITILALWFIWPRETVGDVRREVVAKLNNVFSDSSSQFWKRIEDAHITVTVYKAYVLSCDVTTKDGSNKVGVSRSNILNINTTVRFCWNGIFQRGGTTDVEFILTSDWECISTRIVRTDALFNTETPEFWWSILMGTLAL